MELKRVVVTGMGTINPLGHNITEFWENLKSGVSGAGPITRFNPEKFKTRFACEVKNFEEIDAQFFNKKETGGSRVRYCVSARLLTRTKRLSP